MLAVILVGFLLASQATSGKRQFVPIEKRKVPHDVLMASCDAQLEECRERFLRVGEAWRGDINDDGRPELIIFPGTGGSGGEDASLFQRRGTKWVELLSWFPYVRRYDILPFTRQSYHDLCLADRYCFKRAGKSYVPYVPTDYRKLSTRWFNARRPDDAEMLWLIRYAGSASFSSSLNGLILRLTSTGHG